MFFQFLIGLGFSFIIRGCKSLLDQIGSYYYFTSLSSGGGQTLHRLKFLIKKKNKKTFLLFRGPQNGSSFSKHEILTCSQFFKVIASNSLPVLLFYYKQYKIAHQNKENIYTTRMLSAVLFESPAKI